MRYARPAVEIRASIEDQLMTSEQEPAQYRPPFDDSAVYNLFEDGDLDRHEAILRAALDEDLVMQRDGRLNSESAKKLLSMDWYQRILDTNLQVTTRSDHNRVADIHPGVIHTLYGRFTSKEGAALRPLPKLLYTEKLLPDLRGKSVLEIGSSCGFWSLKFAELGAARVTGVEAIATHVESAREMAERNGVADRVSFINGDAFYDKIEPHDIVFYSEVLGHSLVPHHAFLRTLGLAKELVIADEFFGWDDKTDGQFFMSGDPEKELFWTGYAVSENAALTLCYLAGVDLSKVTRYRNQFDGNSTLMIIPMDGAAEGRRRRLRHPSQLFMMSHAMGLD